MASIDSIINDYKEFVKVMQEYSEAKVKATAYDISNKTNALYKADGVDQKVRLVGNATKFSVSSNKNGSTAIVSANESKELIYLEFGTRGQGRDNLTIRTGFDSGLDTPLIAAPYKGVTYHKNKAPINGRYYFLDTIDTEGVDFVRNFMK